MYKSKIIFTFLMFFIIFVIFIRYHAQKIKKRQGEHFEKQNVHSSYVMDTNFYFGNVPPNILEKNS